MAITTANATAFIRSLIGESSAKYWTDTEITLYMQFAMAKVLAEMVPWLWEKHKDYASLATTAGTAGYDPPNDSYKVSHIQIKETGKKIRYISEDEWYKFAYINEGMTITDDDYFIVWYMKNLDSLEDFPDPCRVLIAIDAAIMARAKNEDVTPDLLNMRKEAHRAALTDLSVYNMHQVEAFPDYREEDSIDESFVWTWKGGKITFAAMD